MKGLKRLLWGLAAVLLLAIAATLHYALPRHALVHVVGSEVKQLPVQAPPPGGMAVPHGRGVFYFNTTDLARQDVQVFRNEDTGWGFPWYLKFDSAEVQARAQLLSRDESQMAIVRYYGWRIPMFSLFPNAVDVWATDVAEEPWPVFNIIFFTLLALLVATLAWRIRRWRAARRDAR